ncbi:MAG: hypothetical protein AB2L24_31745 [Mangrovibacterium sp.]
MQPDIYLFGWQTALVVKSDLPGKLGRCMRDYSDNKYLEIIA